MTEAMLGRNSQSRLRIWFAKANWMATGMSLGRRGQTEVLVLLLVMCWNHSIVNGQLPQLRLPAIELPSLPLPSIELQSLSLPTIGLPPLPSIGLPPLPSIRLPPLPIPTIGLPPLPSIGLPPLPSIGLPSLPILSIPGIPGIPGMTELFPPPTRNPTFCYWEDSMALFNFRQQLSDPRGALSSWNPLTDCCGWRGVTCSSTSSTNRRVIGLQLSIKGRECESSFLSVSSTFSNIAGVPLAALSALETLSLTSVAFNTDLPLVWGQLWNLTSLTLVNCGLTGGIPPAYSRLRNLRHLHLSNNRLRGVLPLYMTEVFRQLLIVDLSSNSFTGGILLLFRSNVTSLDLARNEFDDDPLPDLFFLLSQLRHLDLSHNHFKGSIPQSLQTLQELRFLDLSSNQLEGSIPPALFLLESLTSVFLQDNQLSGSVPLAFATGSQIRELDLSNNDLSGIIPPTIGVLGGLQLLDLSSNNLTALIPDTLMFNSQLEFLFLESNHLFGLIPQELAALQNLLLVNVSHNFLLGPIPGGPWPSFPTSSFDANLALCGPPLQKCPLTFPWLEP